MFKPARVLITASILALVPLFLLVPLVLVSPSHAASSGDVVINEIQADSIDGSGGTDDDWIELYNPTDGDIDLATEGYRIEKTKKASDPSIVMRIGNASDGTYPGGTVIPAQGFYLIVRDDAGQTLKDEADAIGSRSEVTWTDTGYTFYLGVGAISDDADSDIVDKVGFGGATYYEGTGSAPAIPDGKSIARNSVGEDTDDNSVDFAVQETPTPGSENTGESGDDDGEEETTYSDQIFLNEIMPNPEGSDDNEYLELYNASDEEIDLSDWIIKDLTSDKVIGSEISLSSTLTPAKGFLVIYKKDGSVSLNNSGGDTITLLNPNDEVVDEVSYPEIDEGRVYQRYPDGESGWSESNEPTAGEKNKPSSVTSDTSGSSDPEVIFSVEGNSFKVNKSFDVKIEIKNAKPLHDYYVKIRLGLSESKLTKGRTYNSFYDEWLADNKSWSKFPILYTDSSGTWDGTISAKVASGNPADTYIIGVRIRDKETEKNYDSETQTIEVGEEDLSSEASAEEGADGAVLGTLTELPATGGGGWLPVLIWMVLIFIGSSLPGASVSENRAVDFLAHKAVHLFEYSVLFVLIYRAAKKSFSLIRDSFFFILSFSLLIIFAVTDEVHQLFVRGRDARLTDILIDAAAALLGWLILKRSSIHTHLTTAVGKRVRNLSKIIFLLLISSSLAFITSTLALSADILSLIVPDGFELKEGEIDHLSATIEIFNTQGAAINFKPNFNFDLAGFATFVYSYEGYYGALEPSVFSLTIYEGLMEHSDLDSPLTPALTPTVVEVVEGTAGYAPNYELFFGFDPIPVKGGQDYTAILTVDESVIPRYRFWFRSQYQDGFALTFNPQTQEFSQPSSASVAAPFGLFVQEGWQGTPPRFHPVVLIHGMGGKPSDWQLPEQDYVALIQEMYADDEDFDYPPSWIYLYHYGYDENWVYNYQGDIREIALGLEAVVEDLATRYAESFGETLESLEERDEDRVVDLIGYSVGGLVARQYLIKHKDDHHIRKLVAVATPHEGIYWLGRKEGVGTLPRVGEDLEEAISGFFDLGVSLLDKSGQFVSLESEGVLQMVPGSEFLGFLNMVEWTPLDVGYYTIYGDIDIVLKEKIFFFTMEKKVALGDVFVFSESATGIPAVEPEKFGYNEEWTFPVGMAISPGGVSANFYIEGLDITKFRFWHLGILHQPEIKDKTVSILTDEI